MFGLVGCAEFAPDTAFIQPRPANAREARATLFGVALTFVRRFS